MLAPWLVKIYMPPWMAGHKRSLVERIGKTCGGVIYNADELRDLPDSRIPAVCCTPEIGALVREWRARSRPFVYWDRGYLRRLGGWFKPRDGEGTGFYRCHANSFQLQRIASVPDDRWQALAIGVQPWRKGGRKIIVADTLSSYWPFHGIEGWADRTMARLRELTDRPIVLRQKLSGIPLDRELADAHCVVTHGSNIAIEAVVMGCPVFVDQTSAAALVGRTDLSMIEQPLYPDDRMPWLHALCYSQFDEREMCDGTLWRMIE